MVKTWKFSGAVRGGRELKQLSEPLETETAFRGAAFRKAGHPDQDLGGWMKW